MGIWEDRAGGRNLGTGVGDKGMYVTRSRTAMLMRNIGGKKSNVLKKLRIRAEVGWEENRFVLLS